MSPPPVQTIVARVIEEINNGLTPIHNTTGPITAKELIEIEKAIVAPINKAYAEVMDNEEDTRILYHQLSRKFHTDRWNNKEAFALKLKELADRASAESLQKEIIGLGQKAINAKQTKDPNEIGKTFFTEYERYPYLIQYLIFIAQALLNIPLIIASIAIFFAAIAFIFVAYVYMELEQGLLGLILGNSYVQVFAAEILPAEITRAEIAAIWKLLLAELSENLSEESDEGVIEFAIEFIRTQYDGVSDEDLDTMLKFPFKLKFSLEKITELNHANLTLKALYNAITAPGNSGFLLNNLYRVFLIAAIVPVAALLMGEIALLATGGLLFLAALAAMVAIKLAATLAVNSPLYLYDAFAGLYTYLSTPPAPGTENTANNQETSSHFVPGNNDVPPTTPTNETQANNNYRNTTASGDNSAATSLFGMFNAVKPTSNEKGNNTGVSYVSTSMAGID